MTKIEILRDKVDKLYKAKNDNRDEWADWLYEHALLVGAKARGLAKRYGADDEVAEAAGLLHDIGDAVMKRKDPGHEEETAKIARKFLSESGYSDNETEIIIGDALRFHACHNSERPRTVEGKVVAAADGAAHLQSDFYPRVLKEKIKEGEPLAQIKNWVLEKIDRDFQNKIGFNDLQTEVKEDYQKVRSEFVNLKKI